ncbi:hypothetical protein RB195_019439 [Necator americanus]|uniref:Phosphatidic acid phosphatase type 2/haloperoxidase domain-containing protein n=1 Tax=Necator americanus TaxID=51031 RepID=A0ABR1CE94_NECAM
METPIANIDDVRVINGYAFLADTILLISFGLVGAALIPELMGTFHRGFFCNDQTIQYPYKEDTITPTVLFLYSFLAMILAIVGTECYRARKNNDAMAARYRLGNFAIHSTIVRTTIYIGYSLIGFMCVLVLTNVTKSCVGRLRPHFLDVCKPLNITCHDDTFYNDYTCTGNPLTVEEARKSFFSGHSSISMYASTFTALYLLARFPSRSIGRTVIPVMQTALIASGTLISLSRINDNKHHWSDVIIGIFVGVFVATYTSFVWARMFVGEEGIPLRQRYITYVDGTTDPSNHLIVQHAETEQNRVYQKNNCNATN